MKLAVKSEASSAPAVNNEITYVPLELIASNSDIPHRELDKDHVEELKASIRKSGLDTPLIVWGGTAPDAQMKIGDSKYPASFLIAGAHRRDALKQLRKEDEARFNQLFPKGVPVSRRICTLAEALCIQLRENVQRKDMTSEQILPVVQHLVKLGVKQNVIAARVGKTPGWVSQILDIAEGLGDEGLEEVKKGGIGMRDARKISKDAKAAKSKGETPNVKEALEKARSKRNGKKRNEKRVSLKALYDRYNALPGTKIGMGRKLQILEGVVQYTIGQVDEIPDELKVEEKPAKGKK